jgi:BirA family transcriptional regulator, biotin operon repressor / biotin---[acetyl-CoA-carboxylase] ligase
LIESGAMNAGLDPQRIEVALRVGLRGFGSRPGDWAGTIAVRANTESTNDDAFRQGREGAADGTAVFAEEQRAGRGRRERRWTAPPRRNLTFSVVIRTSLGTQRWPCLAHGAALAVARGIDPWLEPLHAEIKWPNDIYADGRKLGGILLEAYPQMTAPFLVVGIGLNVNSTAEEIAAEGVGQEVTSIVSLNGGREVDRNDVAGAVLAELWRQIRRCEVAFDNVRSELRGRSWLLGKRLRVSSGNLTYQGEALDLGENGELLIRDEIAGEIREIVSADLVRTI